MTDQPGLQDAGSTSPRYASRERLLAAGETVIQEGEQGDTAYCILEGEVSVWKHTEKGSIELARLGAGDIFGEMSIVDEKPRSASVTAVRDTRLKELKRTEFLKSFQHDPDFAASLLRVLFERLRETGAKLTQLQHSPASASPSASLPEPAATAAAPDLPRPVQPQYQPLLPMVVTLEGLTKPAQEALPSHPYVIDKLPCRIGRASDDNLACNDLVIHDFEPYQISVNHLLIFQDRRAGDGIPRIGIFDRGSARGSWLNDCRLGGLMGDENATFLESDTAELVLGEEDSLFRFRLTVKPA
jgi:hypothetical protein